MDTTKYKGWFFTSIVKSQRNLAKVIHIFGLLLGCGMAPLILLYLLVAIIILFIMNCWACFYGWGCGNNQNYMLDVISIGRGPNRCVGGPIKWYLPLRFLCLWEVFWWWIPIQTLFFLDIFNIIIYTHLWYLSNNFITINVLFFL